ncbi:hypothetical protein L6164_018641 [Bauhinia variegata]|uniref:Uncharacterized protein n=1 Tax=Bauhinia variegata TaxID=167791 RepID=A0ACB9ND74_BAUVA|nr:hypothetical protein L6164_018641 [Bauhinia variegata]
MEAFNWSSDIHGNAPENIFNGFLVNHTVLGSGIPSSSSLVLDSERGELVEAPAKLERKGVSTERSIAALKNHSEAERRRRARVNSHLDTLRSVIPGAKKMDKASLLAEVIRHLKDLKRNAAQACEGLMIPNDSDEIRVEEQEEIATLGGWMKNVFVIISCKQQNIEDAEYRQLLAGSVHQALRSVLDRFSTSQDLLGTRKRRRISIFSSSSLEDFLHAWWTTIFCCVELIWQT